MGTPEPSDTVEHQRSIEHRYRTTISNCSSRPSRSVPVSGSSEGVSQLARSGKYKIFRAYSSPETISVRSIQPPHSSTTFTSTPLTPLLSTERTSRSMMGTPEHPNTVEYCHSAATAVCSCHPSRSVPVFGTCKGVSQLASSGKYKTCRASSYPESSPVHSTVSSHGSTSQSTNATCTGESHPSERLNQQSAADRTMHTVNDAASSLKFYFQNVRGLKTKIADFYLSCIDFDYDVIMLVETWLDSRINSVQLFGNQYEVYRIDRNRLNSLRGVGGGVIIAVKKTIDSTSCDVGFCAALEQLFVTIHLNNVKLFVGCFYLPPEKSKDPALMKLHIDCIEKVRDAANMNDIIIIAGDYNQPKIVWKPSRHGYMYVDVLNTTSRRRGGNEATVQETLLDGTARCNLLQVNPVGNYNRRHLDLVFVSDGATYTLPTSADEPLVQLDVKHPALVFDVKVNSPLPLIEDVDTTALNFKKTDYSALSDYFQTVDWESITNCNDVNEALHLFNVIVQAALPRFTPRFKPPPKPIWGNAQLRSLKRIRAATLRKYTRNRNPITKAMFNRASGNYRRYNRQRYAEYVRGLQEQLRQHPAKFWSFVRSKHKENGLPVTVNRGDVVASTNAEKCEVFADHFASVFNPPNPAAVDPQCLDYVPLDVVDLDTFRISEDMLLKAVRKLKSSFSPGPDGIPPVFVKKCIQAIKVPFLKILNLSMQQAQFPSEWKKSVMFPVFKKGKKQLVENYRGITSLSAGSKVLELIVSDSIMFNCRGHISTQQHGFMPGRSVDTNLMEFTSLCFDGISRGNQVDVIYTDLKAAFDRIDHDIVLKKFEKLGFSVRLCSWLESYLKQRTLQVKIGATLSQEFTNYSGVPQGSNLGPILFILFFNDATHLFTGNCKIVYADDFKLYIEVKSLAECHILQSRLTQFAAWCNVNRMTLSVEKCVTISFHHKLSREAFRFNYSIGGHMLERVQVVKDLGVYLDSNLSFRQHQQFVVDKANRQLGFMFKIAQEFDDPLCLRSLYFALVRSHLESSTVIWSPYHSIWIRRIEGIQRKFVWYALRNLRWSNPLDLPPYEARCQLLGITTLEKRREIAKAVFAAKLLSSETDCSYLLEQLNVSVQARLLRPRAGFLRRPLARTDYLQNSPLHSMSAIFNKYFHLFEFGERAKLFQRRLLQELN